MINSIINELQREVDEYGPGAVVDNDSRLIVHDEERIFIFHKQSEQFEYGSYSQELYYFLCCPSISSFSWDYDDHRLMVEIGIKQKNGKRWKRNLSQFLDLWYHRKDSAEEFLQNLPTNTGKTTDHVNNDKRNNCSWNLMEMTRSENSKKGTVTTQIKPPYFFYPIVDENGKIRVHFGYRNPWHGGQSFYILCENVKSLISLCKAIMSIENAPSFLFRHQTPSQLWKEDKEAPYAAEDMKSAAREENVMRKMEESEFRRWEVGYSFAVPRARSAVR